jgi:hypothetical protein
MVEVLLGDHGSVVRRPSHELVASDGAAFVVEDRKPGTLDEALHVAAEHCRKGVVGRDPDLTLTRNGQLGELGLYDRASVVVGNPGSGLHRALRQEIEAEGLFRPSA